LTRKEEAEAPQVVQVADDIIVIAAALKQGTQAAIIEEETLIVTIVLNVRLLVHLHMDHLHHPADMLKNPSITHFSSGISVNKCDEKI